MTTSRGRTALRRTAAVLTALPLTAGVLIAAAPAASAEVTAPGDGTVYTSYSTVQISASYPASSSNHSLSLTSPGGPTVTVDTAGAGVSGGTMTHSVDTGCWTRVGSSCRPAPNGTWTLTQTGGDNDTSTFFTRVAPRKPENVNASAVSSREIRVSWRLGDEPDLVGWVVFEGSQVVKDNVGRGACEGTTCSAVVGYDAEGSGEHTYVVQAFRSSGRGDGSLLQSPLSAPASARLDPPPPPPSQEPAPSEGDTGGEGGGGESGGTESGGTESGGTESGGGESGSTSKGSGGSSSGSTGGPGGAGPGGSGRSGGPAIGTSTNASGASADQRAIAQRKAFALSFSAFGPKLGIPKLPPLPQAQAPAIAPELPDGTYEPTLGFEEQVVTERVPVTVAQGPTERVRNVVGGALDSERLVRSTAGALVLLLVGAHLRRWLAAAAVEEH